MVNHIALKIKPIMMIVMGEQTVEVDSRMLAKLIAAGADIEKL
jgi:hypothetical protein